MIHVTNYTQKKYILLPGTKITKQFQYILFIYDVMINHAHSLCVYNFEQLISKCSKYVFFLADCMHVIFSLMKFFKFLMWITFI